jgi:hypothetical protein
MATKKIMKAPIKKYAGGGSKTSSSKACPRGQAWDVSLQKCVDIDDPSQSIFGYSIKGGKNWFGEDSPMDGEYARERNAAKNKAQGEALGKDAAARLKKLLGYKKGGTTKMKPKMKTGGMVNPNAKIQAAKAAGSKGVKSGVNPKAAASKVARGRSGGTSVAPKTAVPKAKYGMSVKRK